MLVLGVDPSIASAGLAIVDCSDRRPLLVWQRTVYTDPSDTMHSRMSKIWSAGALAIVEFQPALIAMENPDRVQAGASRDGRTNKDTPKFLRSTGIPHCLAAAHALPFVEVTASEVKSAVGVVGSFSTRKAMTAAMARSVRMLVVGMPGRLSEHANHAIACAIGGARKIRSEAFNNTQQQGTIT